MELSHQPVLVKEVLEYLAPQANENFVDCTLGGGGHAQLILEKTGPQGKLLGIDLDETALAISRNTLKSYNNRALIVKDNYKNLKKILHDNGFNKINGILLDLGLSSIEMQDPKRGFSFQGSAVLDMRFGDSAVTAADILNEYSERDLIRIFKDYGEERYSREIASRITGFRKKTPFKTTDQLVTIIESVYKNKFKPKKIHVATKIFQALRMEVNDELNNIKAVLPDILDVLEPNGRLVIISFHSLEDRIVKQFMKQEAKDCLCPPQMPICQCHHQAKLKILTKKIIQPTEQEISNNSRSRSAKLRAAVKIS